MFVRYFLTDKTFVGRVNMIYFITNNSYLAKDFIKLLSINPKQTKIIISKSDYLRDFCGIRDAVIVLCPDYQGVPHIEEILEELCRNHCRIIELSDRIDRELYAGLV